MRVRGVSRLAGRDQRVKSSGGALTWVENLRAHAVFRLAGRWLGVKCGNALASKLEGSRCFEVDWELGAFG